MVTYHGEAPLFSNETVPSNTPCPSGSSLKVPDDIPPITASSTTLPGLYISFFIKIEMIYDLLKLSK
jgi:hypothetical protein